MLQSRVARPLSRAIFNNATASSRTSYFKSSFKLQTYPQTRVLSSKPSTMLALTLHKPASTSLRRYATTTKGNVYDETDVKAESQLAKEKLEAHPDLVAPDSSVRHVFREEGVEEEEKNTDMMAGIKADLKTIRETFTLRDVPREALYIGMAGVLPYLATSLSTVYLAWDINHAAHTGHGFLLSGQTAETLLHIIEPVQVGYGAVLISFLGAIHWGLEWAGYGGTQGYSRYAIGVVAPAVAWPTMLLPVESALICQFLAFNFLYFTDARATARGWAPPWYGIYRFVLTFIVGASIVISLIGRGQIVNYVSKPSNAAAKIRELQESRSEYLAKEEEEKEKMIAKGARGGDDDEEEEDDE